LSIFVDTSVWSLAFRRDSPSSKAEVRALTRMIEQGVTILTTGLILQELLQGFSGPKAYTQILDRFSAVPLLVPNRDDHVAAAELRNRCRRAGLQIGTIDALLAQLCIRHNLTMLSSDKDFIHIASRCALKVWTEPPSG
jgi:predicted nucleic acid-binding protein